VAPAPTPVLTQPPVAPPTPTAEPDYRRPSNMMNTSKNILSSDVEIKGSLKFSNDLVIDGKIEGEINSDGSLTVGENARVKGEIRTKSCIVFGKVEGNITVLDRCELKTTAELVGDVKAKTLSIEEGAAFMGKSIVGAAAAAAPAAKLGAPAAPAPAAPAQGQPQQPELKGTNR
jgi:cytoskeletal protein CcmA (bactofilin family)